MLNLPVDGLKTPWQEVCEMMPKLKSVKTVWGWSIYQKKRDGGHWIGSVEKVKDRRVWFQLYAYNEDLCSDQETGLYKRTYSLREMKVWLAERIELRKRGY